MRLEMESALHHAIARRELRVHYQPVVDLRDGDIVGFEALVRWRYRDRKLLAPGEFIPLAEETGLIVPIGALILEAACQQAKRWGLLDRSRRLTVSVNLSGRQLADPGLPATVAEVLTATGLDPGNLCLEITESVLMADAESSMDAFRALKEIGVRLAVDDFGTGYSSLAYLKRFPVDELKIDRSFVGGLDRDPRDAAIVEAVIRLAGALGITAIAEGVEEAAQVARLRTLGCELGQGYFFARPAPAAALSQLLVPRPEADVAAEGNGSKGGGAGPAQTSATASSGAVARRPPSADVRKSANASGSSGRAMRKP